MSDREIEYHVEIHPSGEMEDFLIEQLSLVAKKVYQKETDKVVYRVLRVREQTNPRKLFIPGDGEIVEAEILPHIGLGQKIMIEEKDEEKVIQRMEEISSDTKPFVLNSTRLGDYGEDFTIFVAFSQSNEADKLVLKVREKMEQFSPAYKEKRDLLHFTLVYDDVSPENIEKAWKVVKEDKLINKKLQVTSVWLWKNHKPYKEFTFETS
jgi:2'-5' RNA ligase